MGERKGRGRSYRPPQKKRGLANSTTPVKWGDVPASISIPIPAPARETSTGAGDRVQPVVCLFGVRRVIFIGPWRRRPSTPSQIP